MTDVFTKITSAREERVKDLHLDYEVPTWDGDFVARFRVLDRKSMEKFGTRKRSSEVDQDFIIRALDCLYVRDPDKTQAGERMPENDDYVRVEKDGVVVKFDQTLAEMLRVEGVTEARQVVLHVFDNNAIAMGGLVMRLIKWMQNTDADVSESIVGE